MGPVSAGALLGLSIAAPPGPVVAAMATEAVRGLSRQSILTGFGAMTADATWLGVAALGFVAYPHDHERAVGALGLCGAADLEAALVAFLRESRPLDVADLPLAAARDLSELHARAEVVETEFSPDAVRVTFRAREEDVAWLRGRGHAVVRAAARP